MMSVHNIRHFMQTSACKNSPGRHIPGPVTGSGNTCPFKPNHLKNTGLTRPGGGLRQDYILNNKTKKLLQLALDNVLQYPAGTRIHAREALMAGATGQELAEIFILAALDNDKSFSLDSYSEP